MTTHQDMDKYVVNPYTGRLVKKGSKTHKRLVSAKLLDEPLAKTEDNLIMDTKDRSEARDIKTRMSRKSVGQNKIITTRNNKVLKANRRPRQTEIVDKVSDIAVSSVIEHRDELLSQDLTDEELDSYIKKMIQLKLIGHTDLPKPRPQPPSRQEELEYSDEEEYSQ
jgi:hypothetical protein